MHRHCRKTALWCRKSALTFRPEKASIRIVENRSHELEEGIQDMPIPESQLETWTHQGATTTAKSTHETIRRALAADSSPIKDKDFEIYLQGSYKNDTNIRGDSDVDVVVQLNSTFDPSLSSLDP